MKSALVLTTINIPNILLDYANNFEKYGHKNDVDFILIGDLNTPSGAIKIIDEISKRGFKTIYFDIEKQKKWLKRFRKLDKIIPYNSDNRRNIGYLLAKERGNEIIISIDDDNYPQKNEDYLLGHSIVGQKKELVEFSSCNDWYNICRHLKTKPKRIIYPRGFPYSKRWKDNQMLNKGFGKIVVNAGLWLQNPDVDAITNLNESIETIKADKQQYLLSSGTFSPINTQNTAFHVDILSCYWSVRMGKVIRGNKIDRYGDIWSGFFAQKVINHMGDRVSFGLPIVVHRRNKHNFIKDLQQELPGIILTEKLMPILESIELSNGNYSESYLDLSEKIREAVEKSKNFFSEEKKYFQEITKEMKIWVESVNKINNET